MEKKVKHITCEKCQNNHIISILKGQREMNKFTCPICNNNTEIQGFIEIISPERERIILSQTYYLHLAIWIIFGISTLCSIICCCIIYFRSESFFKPDIFSVILFLSVNGSWYISVIGLLLTYSAIIEQGLLFYKSVTFFVASFSIFLLYIQSKYFIVPENLSMWFTYLILLIFVSVCFSIYKGRN